MQSKWSADEAGHGQGFRLSRDRNQDMAAVVTVDGGNIEASLR